MYECRQFVDEITVGFVALVMEFHVVLVQSEIWTILALIADDHDDEQTKSIIPLPPLISSPSKITRMRHFLESGFDAKKMLEKLWNRQLVFVGDSIGMGFLSLLHMLSSAIRDKTSKY